MHNVLLCLAYDGTNFLGYQIQKQGRTVQGEIEKSLFTIYKKKISSVSSGRTDAGVHANVQYLSFKLEESKIPIEKLSYLLNENLTRDLRIYWSKEMPLDFHARYSALSRTYYYQLYEGYTLAPVLFNYALRVSPNLDWNEINNNLNGILGTHDFSNLSSRNPQIKNTIRTISSIEIRSLENNIKRIYISADGFLWKMVRTIVGACLQRAKDKKKYLSLIEILNLNKNYLKANIAPAFGLYLNDVQYKHEYGIGNQNSKGS